MDDSIQNLHTGVHHCRRGSKATGSLARQKVTHAGKERSDIGTQNAGDHHWLSGSEATEGLIRQKVTHVRKKRSDIET